MRLKQVVWNLLSNAIKFSPQGSHVTLRVGKDNGGVFITVEDKGVGLDPKAAKDIFNRAVETSRSGAL